jgi:hypothetical protein
MDKKFSPISMGEEARMFIRPGKCGILRPARLSNKGANLMRPVEFAASQLIPAVGLHQERGNGQRSPANHRIRD